MDHAKKRTTPQRQPSRRPDGGKRKPKSVSGLQDREAAFRFWAECQNVRKTASEFHVSHTTIYRILRADKWKDRLPGVIDKVRAQSENQAARAISDNLDAAKKLLSNVCAKLQAEGAKIDADVGDFVRLARYIDEFEGTAPGVVAAELLNDVIGELIKGTETDRSRIVGNALAGLGITDRDTVSRAAKIWMGRLYSQN